MWFLSLTVLASAVAGAAIGRIPAGGHDLVSRQDTEFVGYLISTFSDPNPQVQWHLSKGDSASDFTFLNDGASVLASTVGTRGVRDIYLTTNSVRSEYFIIATGGLLFENYVLLPAICTDRRLSRSRHQRRGVHLGLGHPPR